MEIVSRIKPLTYLPAHLEYSAYPFYREAGSTYLPRLLNASMQVIETDIPALYPVVHDKVNALKKLMVMLCHREPYEINISKLTGAVELNQKTLYKYLGLLQAAGLLRLLGAKSSGVSIISKPEKLFCHFLQSTESRYGARDVLCFDAVLPTQSELPQKRRFSGR